MKQQGFVREDFEAQEASGMYNSHSDPLPCIVTPPPSTRKNIAMGRSVEIKHAFEVLKRRDLLLGEEPDQSEQTMWGQFGTVDVQASQIVSAQDWTHQDSSSSQLISGTNLSSTTFDKLSHETVLCQTESEHAQMLPPVDSFLGSQSQHPTSLHHPRYKVFDFYQIVESISCMMFR
jgi:hypothetical protein